MSEVSVYVGEANTRVVSPPSAIEISVDLGKRGERGSRMHFGSSLPTLSTANVSDDYSAQFGINDIFVLTTDGASGLAGDIFEIRIDENAQYAWYKVFSMDGFSGSSGTVITHTQLDNLDADDHPQYVLADGTRSMTTLTVSNDVSASAVTVSTLTPATSNHLTSKDYVDTQFGSLSNDVVRGIRYNGTSWPARTTVSDSPADIVMWIGGTDSPTDMVDGDVWVRS